MKVVHFIASIDKNSGGTTTYMQLLSEELKNQLQIIVVTGVSANPIKLNGVRVDFFEAKLSRWFLLNKEFNSFLEIEKPDLVHINGIWNPQNYLFQKVAQRRGIKVILSPHGMLEPYIINRNYLKKKIALLLYQNKALKNVDYFHTTAKLELENIEKLEYKQRKAIIPNGIKMDEFSAFIPDKIQNPRKILFLSRIHPKKGIEFLIEAWSQIATHIKDNWIVEIIGNGDPNYIKSLNEKINILKLNHQVLIKSPVFGKAKTDLFRESTLFVLPTHSENFGIVVAEALASFTPVITTTGTPWEELNTHNCGWWIDLSVEHLKATLQEAMQKSPDELKLMGLHGRTLVEDHYDVKVVAQNMKKLYSNILDK